MLRIIIKKCFLCSFAEEAFFIEMQFTGYALEARESR